MVRTFADSGKGGYMSRFVYVFGRWCEIRAYGPISPIYAPFHWATRPGDRICYVPLVLEAF